MKRFLYIMTVALAAASCRVVDGDVTNPTTDDRISAFCADVFEERVSRALEYFYNAYYIARFVQGDAELKVSPEYDYIRTGLSAENGVYSYDYRPYDFHAEDFFGENGVCEVESGRWYSITITRVGEEHWRMAVNDGTVFNLVLMEESEDGILLNMKVDGVMTEESSFTARLDAEDMEADIRHARHQNQRSGGDQAGQLAHIQIFGHIGNVVTGAMPLPHNRVLERANAGRGQRHGNSRFDTSGIVSSRTATGISHTYDLCRVNIVC